MQLYIVRHAQSTNNANMDNPNEREADPPLTELGEYQADLLANHFRNAVEVDRISDTLAWRYGGYDTLGFRVNRIVCSAMQRSLQTAQALHNELDVPVKVWVDLHERGGVFLKQNGNFRGFPGMTRDEIRERHPNFDLPGRVTQSGWWVGDFEYRDQAVKRAKTVAERLLKHSQQEWRGDNVILVSHAGFQEALVKAILGELNAHVDDSSFFYFYNTSITRIDYWHDGRIGVRYMNRVDHLPIEMIS